MKKLLAFIVMASFLIPSVLYAAGETKAGDKSSSFMNDMKKTYDSVTSAPEKKINDATQKGKKKPKGKEPKYPVSPEV